MNIEELGKRLEGVKARSAWDRGVKEYALDFLYGLSDRDVDTVPDSGKALVALLRGDAETWKAYSYGACSLVCNASICERLCTESEKRRVGFTRYGDFSGVDRNPNSYENWLDVQARALGQAADLLASLLH